MTYLQFTTAGQRTTIKQATCRGCGGTSFRLLADPTLHGNGGAAQRVCVNCGRRAFLADSQELWPLAKPRTGSCPACAGEVFTLAVAFVMAADSEGDVQWVHIGALCPVPASAQPTRLGDRVPAVSVRVAARVAV